ncbi:hypothetical protein tinsulaeT_23750 [Thalassotalea insulae]|uniref:Resolvase/invertase-type recombinase catalytic domain-containing protein n=1 Tax=Thalassotalea insulae TaxID=2056778 RepID=A0ABQ6GSW4_9GAMM|nr:helix-turn-helix domain-containing protein [Thalassotalea insulae]GLX79035.1 hypothetical protein tinsulaeT_23750 [Thalassotalea insulae]
MLLERQRGGIAIAKAKGKYRGKPANIDLHNKIRELFAQGVNKTQIAKTLSCSRQTVYKVLG